jgi:hypothetical protein
MESPFILWRLFALDPARLSSLERTLLRVALALALIVLSGTFCDLLTFAGVDLRNRVVGARAMLAGYDPYVFVWQAGMPETLLDPVFDPKAHRLTLSPPTLLLYAAVARVPYQTIRIGSFAAEWAALIASLALLARSLAEQRQRVILLLGALAFVVATDVWRLHLERGQIYVFYLLALSLALYLSRIGHYDSIGAGIALGVLGLMRPNLLLIAPALILLRQWRSVTALTTTVAIGLIGTASYLPPSSWRSYLDVGNQYFRVIQDPDSVPDQPRPTPTTVAEGSNFSVALPNVESSSFAVFWSTLHESFGVPKIDIALASKLILVLLAAGLLGVLYRNRGGDARFGFALALILSLDTEFFLPHRWGYADVMLLAPLTLLLPELLRAEHRWAFAVVLFGLLSGPFGQPFFGLYVATLVRSWVVMGGLSALALRCWIYDGKRIAEFATINDISSREA